MSRKTAVKAFDKQLKTTLKHIRDADWLGQHAHLASPYFLGITVDPSQTHVTARGQALQSEVRQAWLQLWGEDNHPGRDELQSQLIHILQEPDSPRYAYLVLELRYFQQSIRPRRLSDIWTEYLGVSRAEFYRNADTAVRLLGDILLRQLHPTFRAETPLTPPELWGRRETIEQANLCLQQGQCVTLTGAGGTGKTTLGSVIAQNWQPDQVFWFTIRPTLNDTLHSLLYALGHFLHKQGASSLWQLLLAEGGKLDDPNVAISLVRHDLADLPQSPLICFDELDQLDKDTATPQHLQLREFIESLPGQASLLLIGQRAIIDCENPIQLSGLTRQDLADWLTTAKVPFISRELRQLHNYTRGNPRLVRLCIALAHYSENLTDLLLDLPQSPALYPLFTRLWTRSSQSERVLLQQLSAFRNPVGRASLAMANGSVDKLLARQLIQQDQQGGLLMWPALRDLIYRELSAEQREQAHLQGAAIRAGFGEYTAAAYHFQQAGAYKQAVQLWFPRRHAEIERGQADAALAVFEAISLKKVPKREREALALLRAELKQLRGDLLGGLADLEAVDWTPAGSTTLSAKELQGYFLNARGYPDKAIETYQEGLTLAAQISNQMVKFRNRQSRVHIRQGNLDGAWHEARLAYFEATNLQGVILRQQGKYDQAIDAHQNAIALAESLDHPSGIAKAHHDIAAVYTYLGQVEQVIKHIQSAISYYERIGFHFKRAIAQVALSASYIQVKQFEKAQQTAQDAYDYFLRVPDPYGRATASANLAEANFELGNFSEAERFAYDVLQQEEPYTLPYAFYTIGSVRQAQERFNEARQAFASSADIARHNGDTFILAYALRALGVVMVALGMVSPGRGHLTTALHLFQQLNLPNEISETETLLAN